MLPVALFLARRKRNEAEPKPDVLDEEYEWVFGRKPRPEPQSRSTSPDGRAESRSPKRRPHYRMT